VEFLIDQRAVLLLKGNTMDINLATVMLHIQEPLNEQLKRSLEDTVREGSSGSPVEASTCWGQTMVGIATCRGEYHGHHGRSGRAWIYLGGYVAIAAEDV
jgi:hypothetical protein